MKIPLFFRFLLKTNCLLLLLINSSPAEDRSNAFLFLWPNQNSDAAKLDLTKPIATDRPDFTEASSTVGKGITQLEMGYTFFYDKTVTPREFESSYPELLIRQGMLANWFEFRLATNISSIDTKGSSPTGFNDLYLGSKIGLTPQKGILPEVAIMPQVIVPTGSKNFSDDKTLAGTNLLYGWDINDRFSLAGSTQFNRRVSSKDDSLYTQWAQSLTTGININDKWNSYYEYFGLFAYGAKGIKPEHFFNAGVTYLINNDTQWDFRVGSKLNNFSDVVFVGTGISVRIS